MSEQLSDATVLVTGGTGSFGSTMVRRLLDLDVAGVRVLSRDEAKQDDLRQALDDRRARFYLGDVRDRDSVADAMQGVDYVFHAAALKQVPSCEFFPAQAVRTNVEGSANVIEAAAAAGVRSVVCLSTDKAVYPINAMGMTKALMEKTAQAFARNNPDTATVVSVVRYGNVMCTRGSVIPLFTDQIRAGRPLTITDPRMTRFLISLTDSVALVEYAFANACAGDVFVRQGAREHGRRSGDGGRHRPGRAAQDHDDRHPARREALRDAAQPRGDGARRGLRRLLPRAAGRSHPRLRGLLRRGRRAGW